MVSRQDVRICHDNWVPRPMTFLLVSPASLGEDARVIVLIENENTRNTVMFQEHFLPVMFRIF